MWFARRQLRLVDPARGHGPAGGVHPIGGELDGDSFAGAITCDGGAVSFETEATDVGAGDNNGVFFDVLVGDVATETTTSMSRRPAPRSTAAPSLVGSPMTGVSCSPASDESGSG